MRRLITMLTGAIVLLVLGLSSLDASADYYLYGKINSDNWDDNNKKIINVSELTKVILTQDDNRFRVFDTGYNDNSQQVIWAPWDKSYSCNTTGTGYGCKNVTNDESNKDNYFILNKGTYNIQVKYESEKATLYVTKVEDEVVSSGYYLFGDINGVGDSGWTNYTMYPFVNNGGQLQVTVDMTATENKFRFYDGTNQLGPATNHTFEIPEQETREYNFQTKNDLNYCFTLPAGNYTFTLTPEPQSNNYKIVIKNNDQPNPAAKKYYLSGDFNGWMTKENYTEAQLEPYKFTYDSEKTHGENWYYLKITGDDPDEPGYMPANPSGKFHGQFQILKNADFHDNHWASQSDFTLKVEGEDPNKKVVIYQSNGKTQATEAQINEYWSKPTPTSIPETENLGFRAGNSTMTNMHLEHNYYRNATVWFNPVENKCFITGTPEDIYVYYDVDGETNTKSISLVQDGLNEINYIVNPKISDAEFKEFEVPEGYQVPLIEGGTETQYHSALDCLAEHKKILRARVAPGLEEPYTTSDGEFYYSFKITGSSILPPNFKQGLSGSNVYFIEGRSLALSLNLADKNATDIYIGQVKYGTKVLDHIKYRLIAVDGKTPQYVANEELQKEGTLRTSDPSKAAIYEFDVRYENEHEVAEAERVHGFLPVKSTNPSEKYMITEQQYRYWNGHDLETSESNRSMVRATTSTPKWVNEANSKIPFKDSNRYVEFEVSFNHMSNENADQNTPTQYVSDFERTENSYGTVTLKAKGTKNFKLDGTHKYFAHQFDAITTGIDDIEVEGNVDGNAEAVYYTLQGVKTEKPVKGQIYIVVRGNKSSKVVY